MARRITFLLLLMTASVTAELSDIIKLCRNVSCEVDAEYEEFPTTDPDRSFQWMAAGLPYIFWNAVRTGSLFNQTTLSQECQRQLVSVSDGMQRDEEWAFHFVDAAGKTPAGLLKATVTAIGDYDQCLDIHYDGIEGMYCMLDMHHLKKKTSPKQLALSRVVVFGGYPFYSSLCLPSSCETKEVQQAVKNLLKPFLIKVAGDISCDTREQMSWTSRFTNLTKKQIISLTAIACILIAVAFATGLDVYCRLTSEQIMPPQSQLLKSLSLIDSTRRLLYAKPWKFEILVFDGLKLFIVFVGTLAHLLICVESPHGFATIATHKYLNELLAHPGTQFLANDCGLLGIPFLSGIATFAIMYPMAKKKKFPFFAAIFDRFTRFLPPILILTACEFIWPLIGSGPFYKRIADFTLQKCEKNWIYNALFINNFLRPIDICGGHLFSSSVDMQLFFMGLICIFIFSRSEKVGVWFSIAMIAFGTGKVAYNAITYSTAFSMYVVNMQYHKLEEFLYYIHMQTPSYMAAYFTGILLSYYRMKGHLNPDLSNIKSNLIFLFLTALSAYTVNFNAMMHNTFNLYPDTLNWLFISLNRILQVIAEMFMFTYCMSFKSWWENSIFASKTTTSSGIESADLEEETISPFKALCRLCFPMYICNYLYIRTEFFTRRFLQSGGAFWMIKRLVSSVIFVYIFTIAFHLLLLAPVDSIRQHLTRRRRKTEKREHDE